MLDNTSFAVLALDWYKTCYTHFGGFLKEPLITLDVLRWCYIMILGDNGFIGKELVKEILQSNEGIEIIRH